MAKQVIPLAVLLCLSILPGRTGQWSLRLPNMPPDSLPRWLPEGLSSTVITIPLPLAARPAWFLA